MNTQSPIQPTFIVTRVREVKFDQLDDEFYAVDSKAGSFYNMNETGNRVWELLAAPRSVNALCAQIQNEYRVDADTCLRQVTEILCKLRDAGLIEAQDVAAA